MANQPAEKPGPHHPHQGHVQVIWTFSRPPRQKRSTNRHNGRAWRPSSARGPRNPCIHPHGHRDTSGGQQRK